MCPYPRSNPATSPHPAPEAPAVPHFLRRALDVAALTGVRLVLVHAKDSRSASFYRYFGFEPSPVDDLTLMLLVKDINPEPQQHTHR